MRKKTMRGNGWNSLFGIKPTPNPQGRFYKSANGIIIAESKSQRLPLYSKDNGKTYDYILKEMSFGSSDEDVSRRIKDPAVKEAWDEYMKSPLPTRDGVKYKSSNGILFSSKNDKTIDNPIYSLDNGQHWYYVHYEQLQKNPNLQSAVKEFGNSPEYLRERQREQQQTAKINQFRNQVGEDGKTGMQRSYEESEQLSRNRKPEEYYRAQPSIMRNAANDYIVNNAFSKIYGGRKSKSKTRKNSMRKRFREVKK